MHRTLKFDVKQPLIDLKTDYSNYSIPMGVELIPFQGHLILIKFDRLKNKKFLAKKREA